MQGTEKQRKRFAIARRLAALLVMVGVLTALLSQTAFAQNSYMITDGDHVTMHQSYSTDPDVVLDEAGIELSEEDTYTTSYNDGVSRIDIQRMQLVTVNVRGEQRVIGTYGETAQQLLERLGVTLSSYDTLSCAPETESYDGMHIDVVLRREEFVEYDSPIAFETNYFEDPSLDEGEEIVLTEGVDGLVHRKEQIVYENGIEVARLTLEETVLTEPVHALIVRGPQSVLTEQPDAPEYVAEAKSASKIGNQSITTAGGTTYTYSDTLTVTCTAYSCEGYTGITATGTVARVGAVAVDPRYIPLGTKMYIVSNDGQYVYGYCVAEDTGGSIKGMKIDLYFDTVAECWDFGVRTCTVYVIED